MIHEFILAAAAIHTPDLAETEAILDADQPQQTLEDEDPNEEVVNDRDVPVLAEVILPSTVRKFVPFSTFPCC